MMPQHQQQERGDYRHAQALERALGRRSSGVDRSTVPHVTGSSFRPIDGNDAKPE
jgi:hypothetical protein